MRVMTLRKVGTHVPQVGLVCKFNSAYGPPPHQVTKDWAGASSGRLKDAGRFSASIRLCNNLSLDGPPNLNSFCGDGCSFRIGHITNWRSTKLEARSPPAKLHYSCVCTCTTFWRCWLLFRNPIFPSFATDTPFFPSSLLLVSLFLFLFLDDSLEEYITHNSRPS